MTKQHRTSKSQNERLQQQDAWVGVAEAATLLQVGASSIQRFVNEGYLQAWKTEGGHRRISRESIQAMLEQRFFEKLKLRILISDQSEPDREQLVATTKGWNPAFQVWSSAYGVDSILLIERHRPDLWIVSSNLDNLDVLSAASRVASSPEMTAMGILIGISGALPQEKAESLRNLGIQVYRKPWPVEELRGVIANALATKTRLLRKQLSVSDHELG